MNDPLDRNIARLEIELAALRRQKLAELQSQMEALQSSLEGIRISPERAVATKGKAKRGRPQKAVEGLAGEGATSYTRTKKRDGTRGKRIADDEAIAALKKVVVAAGKDGVSAKQTAAESGISYPRAIKLMDANFKKSGSGKGTRYRA